VCFLLSAPSLLVAITVLINVVQPGWDKGIIGDYTPEDPNELVRPMALHEKARFKLPQ